MPNIELEAVKKENRFQETEICRKEILPVIRYLSFYMYSSQKVKVYQN